MHFLFFDSPELYRYDKASSVSAPDLHLFTHFSFPSCSYSKFEHRRLDSPEDRTAHTELRHSGRRV